MINACSGTSPELFVTIDATPRSVKPDDAEEKKIDSRLQSVRLSLDGLRNQVLKGATWCPGVFQGRRRSENFVLSQLVTLDMEHGIDEQEALKICKDYDIMPCWGYYSFSHSNADPRYRLVWRMDKVLVGQNTYEIASRALCGLFRETADKSCASASSRFYGTDNGDFCWDPEAVVNLEKIVDAYCAEERLKDKTNASKRIKQFADKNGLQVDASGAVILDSIVVGGPVTTEYLPNELSLKSLSVVEILPAGGPSGCLDASLPSTSATNPGGPLYIYKSSSRISKSTDATDPATVTRLLKSLPEGAMNEDLDTQTVIAEGSGPDRRRWLQEKVDFGFLRQCCQLMDDLMSGNALPHEETWGLLTILIRCKGGETRFRDGMSARAEWQNPRYQKKWEQQIRRCKAAYYLPMHCDNFCGRRSQCTHHNTPLDQLPIRRGGFRRIDPSEQPMTLAAAEVKCQETINRMITCTDGNIHIGRFATGLGKTTSLLHLIGIILCVPTHNLAMQVVSNAQQVGNDPIYVPDLPSVDADFDAKIAECFRIGDTQTARAQVRARVNEAISTTLEMRTPQEQELVDYAAALTDIENPHGRLVVCTHKRMLLMDKRPYDTVVFDEDVLFKSQLDVVAINMGDLHMPCFDRLIHLISGNNRDVVHTIPDGVLPTREQLRRELKASPPDSILRVLEMDRYLYASDGQIVFGRMLPLPSDATIVVLSATADETLYQAANPGRKVILDGDVTNIEHAGKVIQFPDHSISRASLQNGQANSTLEAVSTVVNDDPVIGLKGQEEKLRSHGLNVHRLHQDACEGSNELEGHDIAVVSTPNKSEAAYRMYADLLGIQVFPEDKLEYTPVKRHGWEYTTTTYPNNPRLQHLQLHLIESTLIQAVGRARTLRNDCTCRVFANVIIPNVQVERFVSPEPRPLHTFGGYADRQPEDC